MDTQRTIIQGGMFRWSRPPAGLEILASASSPDVEPQFTKLDDIRLIALDEEPTETVAKFFPGYSLESIIRRREHLRNTLEDRFTPMTPYQYYQKRSEEEKRPRGKRPRIAMDE